MLTSKKVINAINEQIGYEFSASMQYYAIAAHFAAEALPQFSSTFFSRPRKRRVTRCVSLSTWSMRAGAS
jgi:bacterioferritin B